MIYKLYKDSGKGYQNKGIYTKEEIIVSLDYTIIKEEFKGRILVVEWNKRDDIEFPAMLYTGNLEQYEKFRNYLINEEIPRKTRWVKVKK